MITPSFSLTATERVLPRLALDFLTASLDSRVSVSRALNTATRINSSGLVEIVNANLPRFDYDPVTLACKGLLIEELRANLLLYSSDFTQSAWTKFQLNTSGTPAWTNVAVAPDGTQTADKLIANTVNNAHWVGGSSTITNGAAYTVSAYVKSGADAGDYTFASLYDCNASTYIIVNLATGALVSGTASAYTITPVGSGWYRLSVTATSSSTTGYARVYLYDGTNTNFAGNDAKGIYAWGIQLEAGAFPTSYIPTTTTSLTRNADDVGMTGTNFSDWYNASESTFVASGTFTAFGNNTDPYRNTLMGISDGAAVNLVFFGKSVAGYSTNTPAVYSDAGGIGQQIAGAPITSSTTVYTMALGLKANSAFFAASGVAGTLDTACSVPTVNRLSIGSYYAAGASSLLNGCMRSLRYYPLRLTNAEIQAFSKG